MRTLRSICLFSALSASVALGACGGGTDANPGLDNQTATAVGGALAAQVGGVPASFTATGLGSGGVGGGFFAPRMQAIARWAVPAMRPNLVNRACNPTLDDGTDADGDGVPDDATWTYTLANCTTGNFYITGLVHVVDPSTTAVGYTGTLTNFLAHIGISNGDFFSVKLNGSHDVLGTPTSGTLAENLVTAVKGKSGNQTLNGSLTNNWNIVFDAAQGQNIVMDSPLPDGDFDFNGSYVYDINQQRFVFNVQTETPLVFDSACVLDNPFSSGEIRAHIGGPNGTVYVKVTYTGCGVDPTVVLVGRNT